MSNHLKSHLLLATALVGLGASNANAQVAFPTAELHGIGATSIGQILPRELDCLAGQVNPSADTTGAIVTVSKGVYQGTDATFDCAAQAVQPNVVGLYVQIGSGGGRNVWRNFATSAQYPAKSTWPSSVSPFPATQWSQFHFAFSDAPIDGTADLGVYNTKNTQVAYTTDALPKAKDTDPTVSRTATYGTPTAYGAAIQIPLYVLPVAFAYAPTYGAIYSDAGTYGAKTYDLAFNVATPISVYNSLSGGLRLNKAAYCGIFNGYIINWNDPALEALNTKIVSKKSVTVSLMDPHDSATRWANEGVPIRLVGRLDSSGTTDIFTRHLTAVCSSALPSGQTNHYVRNAQLLPYDGVATISGSNSGYTAGTAVTKTAGDGTNLTSGAVYASGAITGTEQSGKFMLASGSGQVAAALLDGTPANNVVSTVDNHVILNGKFGYIGADWVKPAFGQTLLAAALPNLNAKGTATTWWLPTSANATAAFGTKILPPQSTAKGAYAIDGSGNVSLAGETRANPLSWTNVVYNGTNTLANPATGYPVTGITMFLTETCFKNAASRNAMVTYLAFTTGQIGKDSTGGKLPAALLNGVANGKIGIKTQSNIAPLPGFWIKAVKETFFAPVKTTLPLNLYIQNGLPTAAVFKNGGALPANESILDSKGKKLLVAGPNPHCAAGYGIGDGN